MIPVDWMVMFATVREAPKTRVPARFMVVAVKVSEELVVKVCPEEMFKVPTVTDALRVGLGVPLGMATTNADPFGPPAGAVGVQLVVVLQLPSVPPFQV